MIRKNNFIEGKKEKKAIFLFFLGVFCDIIIYV